MTYEQIAEKHGLIGVKRDRYIRYMRIRWADTESQKCQDGYAAEWAERFKIGCEYKLSDTEGKAILEHLYFSE